MRVGILIPLKGHARESIASMAALGFHSGQLSVWDMELYNTDTDEEIKAACQEFDFSVTALWCGWSGPIDWGYPGMYQTLGLVPAFMREQRMCELLRGAAFARSIGVSHIVTHTGYLPDNPLDPDHMAIVHVLRHIGNTLKEYGQRFLFETGEELPLTLVQLIREVGTGNLGVNFDPANLLINARANPSDAMDLLLPYIQGVHGKDGVYPAGTDPKGREVPVGQGMADFPRLLGKLAASGYDGDITIERETPEGDKRNCDIAQGKAYLEEIIEKVKCSE